MNKELGKREMLGYGGSNSSANTGNIEHFGHTTREDSIFGEKILVLKFVWTMNPWTVIEHIPADWAEIDIVIYHNYLRGFNMGNKLSIKATPMSRINQKDCFKEVWSTKWPLPSWEKKPKDQMIREHVTTLRIPQRLRQEPYAIHFEVAAVGGGLKYSWMFEGIGITNAKDSA